MDQHPEYVIAGFIALNFILLAMAASGGGPKAYVLFAIVSRGKASARIGCLV